jgi:hypothetical protein
MALNDDIRNAAAGSEERAPGLARVYGAAPRDEPPAHLDAAILAAARREVGARPRPLAGLRTWRVPLSLAAVVVLSVSLVTLMREEGGDELYQSQSPRPDILRSAPPAATSPQPSEEAAKAAARDMPPAGQRAPRADAPASRAPETQDRARLEGLRRSQGMDTRQAPEPAAKLEPKPFQDAPESRAVERPAGPPPVMDDAARAPAAIMERSPAAAPPPPDVAAGTAAEARRAPLPQATPAPSRAMRSERDMSREDAAGSVFGGVGATAPKAAEAPRAPGELAAQQRESVPPMPPRVAAMVKDLDTQPPEKWLERIQALRREGQATDARELLAEFKRRYPAHPLPAELQ